MHNKANLILVYGVKKWFNKTTSSSNKS